MDLHIHLSSSSIISIILGILLCTVAILERLKITTMFKKTNDTPFVVILLSLNMIFMPLFNAASSQLPDLINGILSVVIFFFIVAFIIIVKRENNTNMKQTNL